MKVKGMDASVDTYVDCFEALAKALEDVLTGDTLEELISIMVKVP